MQRHKWFNSSIIGLILSILAGLAVASDSTKTPVDPLMTMQVSREIDTTNNPVDSAYRFVLDVRHRVFANFQEFDTVYLNEKFPIGEGDYIGQVFEFNPHLIITVEGKYLKISDTLYNPAVRVRLYQKDSVIQQSWAFYFTDAPHFRRNDQLGFKLVSFEVPDKFIKVPGPKQLDELAADTTKKAK